MLYENNSEEGNNYRTASNSMYESDLKYIQVSLIVSECKFNFRMVYELHLAFLTILIIHNSTCRSVIKDALFYLNKRSSYLV
jgi:hypothetical protein